MNGYQPRTNTAKNQKGDTVADSHTTLNMWKNHFFQLLNVDMASDARQTEIYPAGPLGPDPSASEVAMPIEKLNRYKSPVTDYIPA
jgi:hypothetical protein